jgi:hypothetical protein
MDLNAYWTPGPVVMALLKHERLPEPVWEPACGSGQIAALLRLWGYAVIATDRQGYGYHGQAATMDFFADGPAFTVGSIATNPPWEGIGRWVKRCCQLLPERAALLLPASGLGDVYNPHLTAGSALGLARVIHVGRPVFTRAATGGPFTPKTNVCWFVLARGHRGDAVIHDEADAAGRRPGPTAFSVMPQPPSSIVRS